MREIGAGRLELGRLQAIYRSEVGAWPIGASADALLVEAAEADLCERRRGNVGSLSGLARFVIGVAAALEVAPSQCPRLASWVESLGHQVADSERHYNERRTSTAWLLIDLGGEPGPSPNNAPDTPPWPSRITWTFTHGETTGELNDELPSMPTSAGLAEALKEVFARVPPVSLLLVDLAMPAGLLTQGIERWPLFDVGVDFESLSDRYKVRLRWSQRRRVPALHGKCIDRVRQANWATIPDLPSDAILVDRAGLKQWDKENRTSAWLIGRHPPLCGSDPLRLLLREGHAFLIWFGRGGEDHDQEAISGRVSPIPVAARREQIPNELPDLAYPPVVLWDDPWGRADFTLPPLIAAQSMPLSET